jgi:hypothetical protein
VTPDADSIGAVPGRGIAHRSMSTPTGQPEPREAEPSQESLVIDCDVCSMRGLGCGDCMVTVLLGGPPFGVSLDDTERRAIDALASAGLIPPLRMVQSVAPPGLPAGEQT